MVYEYLCAYEKYRVALTEEYRMQVYKCLLRYPKNHIAIPKNIFAKVSRLYGAETCAAKRIFMNIVLELIHTDIMRDKLFTFIRSNYQTEDEDVKEIIISDLSRVFYGGFLQNQLLTFFDQQFASESDASKSLIIEKLFLSIRTPAVQGKILEFIDRHYENMSDAHRHSFYDTFLEMLPECDALAETLVKTVNNHIEGEPDARKTELSQKLTEVLESDYRRKEHNLMPILAVHPGFCRDLVIRLAFGPWQTRKLHTEYLQLLSKKTIAEKTAALVRAYELVPDIPPEESAALYDPDSGDLYLWLETAEQLNALPKSVAQALHKAVIEPAVCRTACGAFDIRWYTDGMERLEAYAAQHPAVRDCDNYRVIAAYEEMTAAAERQDHPAAARNLAVLLERTELLPHMADHLSRCVMDARAQTPETVLCLEILQNVLRDRTVPLGKLYRKRAEQSDPQQAMSLMLAVCTPLSAASPAIVEALTGAEEMLTAFLDSGGKGARHWLHTQLPPDEPFGAYLAEKLQGQKSAGGSFLSKLFGKKK